MTSNPVDPKDLVRSMKDIPERKPRGRRSWKGDTEGGPRDFPNPRPAVRLPKIETREQEDAFVDELFGMFKSSRRS